MVEGAIRSPGRREHASRNLAKTLFREHLVDGLQVSAGHDQGPRGGLISRRRRGRHPVGRWEDGGMNQSVLNGAADPYVSQVLDALSKYREDHPRADYGAYRQNSAS